MQHSAALYCTLLRCTMNATTRVLVAANLAIVACALRPAAPKAALATKSHASFLPSVRSPKLIEISQKSSTSKILSMSEAGGGDGRPFTRRALLEGVTKAAGVIGAATFVQKCFVSGVPYHGKPDLRGKTAVITGGNTGLGKETAVRLAQLGADVTIACRNPDKAMAALVDIRAQAPGAKVNALQLDLASLSSVDSFAKNFISSSPGLDILVNNAGVMAIPERQTTEEGFERQFGINHLGHFHLTSLLLPSLLNSPDGRVVTVSSAAHMFLDKVDWEDLNAEKADGYGPWSAYGLSKLGNIYFTKELQKRVDRRGGSITCTTLHPGPCRTELGRYLIDVTQPINPAAYPILAAATLVTRSAREGAQTQIACAADPGLGRGTGAGGLYYTGPKISELPSALARDHDAAERMWAASEKLVGKFVV